MEPISPSLTSLQIMDLSRLSIEFESLTKKLSSEKLFLAMCIHDMRNPAVSIKIGIWNSIAKIHKI